MPTSEIGNPSPKQADAGAVCARWVRCGKPRCRCANGGAKHGPYFARYWREGGRRRKEAIRLAEAPPRRAACDARREREREARREAAEALDAWRALLGEIRKYERAWTT